MVNEGGAVSRVANADGSTCGFVRSHQRSYILKQSGLHALAPVSSCVQVMPFANLRRHTKHLSGRAAWY
jgi:hypothetical protein